MTALTLGLLALLVLGALMLVLAPLRQGASPDPDAPERERLEQERDRLYDELRALPEEEPAQRTRTELEQRAARTLRALDALPPAPSHRTRPGWLWGGVALAAALVLAGSVSFIPRWQLGGLAADEASSVRTALTLPALARRAQQTQQASAYLAWGKAAFDAGLYDQAASAYASALKQNPQQPEALRRLGIILLTKEDGSGQQTVPNDQAFLLIRTAAQLAPNDPESQLLLGFGFSRYGEDQLALAALERYRTLNPQGRDADDLISAIRARQNQTDPGAQAYASNCASCHGASGNGGVGPALRAAGLTRDTIAAVVQHGKGSMPAFPNIQGKTLEALVTLVEGWQK
ncbi:c-type cytochrome [Deinococcus sonorensis]|uniref:C-type cytochrome n=2 Tax=Deinococcus sonorensis TaxID=309891 RepID=A0AAU7UFK6_9DEIO